MKPMRSLSIMLGGAILLATPSAGGRIPAAKTKAKVGAKVAADWWLVDMEGTRPNRSVRFVDKASIKLHGKYRTATFMWFKESADFNGDDDIKYTVEQESFDCAAQTRADIDSTSYTYKGTVFDPTKPRTVRIEDLPYEDDPGVEYDDLTEEFKFVCGLSKGVKDFGNVPDLRSMSEQALARFTVR